MTHKSSELAPESEGLLKGCINLVPIPKLRVNKTLVSASVELTS